MPIAIQRIPERDLTVFIASAELAPGEQLAAIQSFYTGTTTANVIWDFREVAAGRANHDEIEQILLYVKEKAPFRKPGKTALVTSHVVDFGISRMTGLIAESKGIPWEVQAFRSIEEASEWIGVRYPEAIGPQ